jgi:hypothetical protein
MRNPYFSGRNSTITELERILSEGEATKECNLVILFGIGGIRKTQVAVEYAFRARAKYSSVLWVDGTSEASLLRSVQAIANAIKNHHEQIKATESSPFYDSISKSLSSPESLKSIFRNWLVNNKNRNWLLIIDNVNDLKSFDFRLFFPSTHNRNIIVTSRRLDLVVI